MLDQLNVIAKYPFERFRLTTPSEIIGARAQHDGKDDVQTNSRIQTAVISAPQPPICITYQRWWPGSPSLAGHVVNAIDGIANVMERSRRAKCSSLSE